MSEPEFNSVKIDEGYYEYTLNSWTSFAEFVNKQMLSYTDYIFRGHGDSNWKLEPTLDRVIDTPSSFLREKHLKAFRYETRSRRGNNPPPLISENDWWALGQHHGLFTPLLDWTESPFVALYFAVNIAIKEKTDSFSIFALWQSGVESSNDYISNEENNIKEINNHKPTVKIFRPFSDENNRLVNQRGLFTRAPNNMSLEEWVPKYNRNEEHMMVLIKLTIKSVDLQNCLRYLNRMNINSSTLFPDLTGASLFCNNHLDIENY